MQKEESNFHFCFMLASIPLFASFACFLTHSIYILIYIFVYCFIYIVYIIHINILLNIWYIYLCILYLYLFTVLIMSTLTSNPSYSKLTRRRLTSNSIPIIIVSSLQIITTSTITKGNEVSSQFLRQALLSKFQ